MTLQEAIKSGKPFKRKIWKEFLRLGADGESLYWDMDNRKVVYDQFSINDVLAEDWEVKP